MTMDVCKNTGPFEIFGCVACVLCLTWLSYVCCFNLAIKNITNRCGQFLRLRKTYPLLLKKRTKKDAYFEFITLKMILNAARSIVCIINIFS